MRKCKKPTYDINLIKELAKADALQTTLRSMAWLREHYDNPLEVVKTVVSQLEPEDFFFSVELKNRPGVMADVYVGGTFDDTEWYVKMFVEEIGPTVQVWSMVWDGSLH